MLSVPNRIRILDCLGTECRPVTDVVRGSGLEQTNVSFHLRLLREAGLVRAERRGRFIYYCLSDPRLLGIVSDLGAWLGESPGCCGSGHKRAAAERPGRRARTTPRGLHMRKE